MEQRNASLSISDLLKYVYRMPTATWKEWTIRRSVKHGYMASGWVYRAISIITRNAAQAPMVIYNPKDEIEYDHPLTKLFAKPNPVYSYNTMIQLLLAWLNLAGEAYIYNNIVNNNTIELWPVSPDRLEPYLIKSDGTLIGYKQIRIDGQVREDNNIKFDSGNTIAMMLPDPADPLRGIGPLRVAARAVDTDTEQSDWNKSAMQNRGVMDGYFSFDREIPDENTFQLYVKKVKERFSGAARAREPGVIGSGAKYQQLSLTPVEMDFLNSRKFNREEIFIIFGVPAQLAGVMDTMTYNNFAESSKVLWEMTILPLLDVVKNAFTHAFMDQLGDYYIGYDLSGIKALKKGEKDKADTAKVYFDMGVPISILNSRFELGLDEYPGWDVNNTGKTNSQTESQVRSKDEFRIASKTTADMRDNYADGPLKDAIAGLMDEQRKLIFDALDQGQINSLTGIIETTKPDWVNELLKHYEEIRKLTDNTEVSDA